MHTHTRAGLLAALSSGDWPELLAILETLVFVGCQQARQVGAATDGEVGGVRHASYNPHACNKSVVCVAVWWRVCW